MSFFDYPTGVQRAPSDQEYFLADCSEEDWAVLLRHTSSRRFRAGEPVLEPTTTERAFYFVIDGTLEAIRVDGRRRRSRPLATFASGTVIGELSFFDGRPRSALVRAVTDGELARLGVEDLDRLGDARPELARAILFDLGRILAGRLREAQSDVRSSLA